MRRRHALLAEAGYRARKLIKDANAESEALQLRGFTDGYRDGILASAEALLQYLDGGRLLAEQLQQELRDDTRIMLSEALEQPETILAVLDDWLRQHVQTGDRQFQLKLPRNAQPWRKRLDDLLETSWGSCLKIDYHDDSRYLLHSGNLAAEFDPPAVVAEAQYLLSRRLDGLPLACRQLAGDAVRRLLDVFEARFIAADDGGEASEDAAAVDFHSQSSEDMP